MLIAENNGALSQAKNIRKTSKERKKSKEEVKNLDIEQSNREWATYILIQLIQLS